MFFFFSERVTIQLRKNDRPRLLVCLVGSKITVNNYYRKKRGITKITKEMKKNYKRNEKNCRQLTEKVTIVCVHLG